MFCATALLATVGLLVSAYGYFIEQKMKQDPTYKPVCDISDKISCSKPFQSPYGSLMKIPNTIFGIGFYSAMLAFSVLEYKQPLFYFSLAAVGVSCYLAYILYVKIKSLCLLCSTIYAVNFGLLLASYSYL